jgi:predicted DNA-binding protein
MSRRFENVEGKVVSIRLPMNVYVRLNERAGKLKITRGEYGRKILEQELIRSHHKKERRRSG